MADAAAIFEDALGAGKVVSGDAINPDYGHDETLSSRPQLPVAVLLPESTGDVAEILRLADEHGIAVTARGTGTGLAAGAVPVEGGVVVSFERMDQVLEIDRDNHVAVVQPGVTLAQLDAALAPLGYVYPVQPGSDSASIGGNVNTNAAGMRAVKYGVTRNHVVGLELVLAGGRTIRCGGKIVKVSSGYDLTQLVIGSEGTLALVTEITCKLSPRIAHGATVLVPFSGLDDVTSAIPRILETGIRPLMLEYIDTGTMGVLEDDNDLELGIPADVRSTALAYLVICIEDNSADRVEEDTMQLAQLLADDLGALDVYVLPRQAAGALIAAREGAFYSARDRGSDDLIDVVVPRAALPDYMRRVTAIGEEHATAITGCGHAGDGNVHLTIFQPDAEVRGKIMRALLHAGVELGGAISGEHGIGREKKPYFIEFEDPVKIELMRGIKRTFDPNGVLNPGAIFD